MDQILDMLGSTILASLMILTALRLNASVVDSSLVNNQNLIVQEEASFLDEILDRDLTNIGYGDTSRVHILFAKRTSLAFRVDLDRNGKIDTVAYYYAVGSDVSKIIAGWGYLPKSLSIDKNDTVIFRLTTINEGLPGGSPLLVTTRARKFSFSYLNAGRFSLGSNPAVPDSIRFVSVSMLLCDKMSPSDTNSAVVDWQKMYRPKNL